VRRRVGIDVVSIFKLVSIYKWAAIPDLIILALALCVVRAYGFRLTGTLKLALICSQV
jgi:hypothetical protein